jgi:hypothetical protein
MCSRRFRSRNTRPQHPAAFTVGNRFCQLPLLPFPEDYLTGLDLAYFFIFEN